MPMRVLVVDDTVVFRRAVSDALAGVPQIEVVGAAGNGRLALSQAAALRPDLITLDIEMPEMNGIQVLEHLAASGSKAGVIMLSARTVRGGQLTMRALELGAFDFITKPDGGSAGENLALLRSQLLPMIRAFERRQEIRSILEKAPAPRLPSPSHGPAGVVSKVERAGKRSGPPLVLIGVSTGGPAALAQLLPSLSPGLAAPVFIVQHMPPLFTEALAQSLRVKSTIGVREASDGETAQNGCVYLAPGGRHMKLSAGPTGAITIRLSDDPPENNCRPAVDYLFRSAALQFPGRSIAAVLTGMGNDGTQGLRLLKRGGCTTIAQDEASCVVFGMPKEAIQAGVVDSVLPLSQIAAAITRLVQEAGS
jgi:two-component system chemotaxis response regulator CheB